MDKNKIRNGGLYLIDLKGNINPEFGLKHYCVLAHTEDKDLFLAFPTTTSNKRISEKYHHILAIDGSIVLFKHVRIISKHRIIGEHTRDGILSVLSADELEVLLTKYHDYTEKISKEAIKSTKRFHESRNKSKENLKLKCIETFEVYAGDNLNYNDLVIEFAGGKITHTEISTKTAGTKYVNIILKDKYNQRITKKVKILIKKKE